MVIFEKKNTKKKKVALRVIRGEWMFLFLSGGGGFRSFMGGWPRIYQDTIGTNGGGVLDGYIEVGRGIWNFIHSPFRTFLYGTGFVHVTVLF